MNPDLPWMLQSASGAVVALTVHEFAHAFVAWRLGDPTAKDEGRLTLNPIRHIDPLGFILIVLAGFGWAKPVRIRREFFTHKHRDEILVSLAGPFSNLLLAVLFLAIVRILYAAPAGGQDASVSRIADLFFIWCQLNIGLFIFNLIPLPPLDGSHVYTTFLHDMNVRLLHRVYQFGTGALLLIIIIQNNSHVTILPIAPVVNAIVKVMIRLFQFPV